jgi:hypothetical protein
MKEIEEETELSKLVKGLHDFLCKMIPTLINENYHEK